MDPFTELIYYFIKLIGLRNKKKDKYYLEVVKGCYECAGYVKNDLIRIFTVNEEEIQEGKPLNLVANNVMMERLKELNKRDYLRATLKGEDTDNFTDFEKGIVLLLTGDFTHALKDNVQQLMKLHQRIMYFSPLQDPNRLKRRGMYIRDALDVNARSIELVNKAWDQINQGYSEHLRQYLKT